MRIAVLLPGFSASETDWAIPVQLNLVRELAVQHDIRVITLRYPYTRIPYAIHATDVYPLGAGQVRGLRRGALWIDALRLIARLHHERPFDVLHAMWADETGLVAVWAGKMLNVPTVVSVAGGELVGLDAAGYGLQRSAFGRWIVRQALSGADRVVVACSYAQKLAENIGRVDQRRIRTIALGVDAERFRPGTDGYRARHIVHAASLLKVKDQETLLRAVAQLDDVTLEIVGQGPEEGYLRALAGELGIFERVIFVGACEYQAMPAVFQRAALHVLPSLHEGQGMVTLEAAACGTPTVGTLVGLLPDDRRLGTAVTVGDALELARAIAGLLGDSERMASLRKSTREAVEDRYTIKHTADNLTVLYKELSNY